MWGYLLMRPRGCEQRSRHEYTTTTHQYSLQRLLDSPLQVPPITHVGIGIDPLETHLIDTVSVHELAGLAFRLASSMNQYRVPSRRITGTNVQEVHEDTHTRLPPCRSGVTVNGRNAPMVGLRTVIEGDMLDGARNVVGDGAGVLMVIVVAARVV